MMRPSLIFGEQVNLQSGQLATTISSLLQLKNSGSLIKIDVAGSVFRKSSQYAIAIPLQQEVLILPFCFCFFLFLFFFRSGFTIDAAFSASR